jgi:hypothetical protein
MQHKQDLTVGSVTKHKARLNLHGGKQEFGTNYYETYHGLPSGFSLSLASYSVGPFTKLTLLWPIHKPPLRWAYILSSQQAFTPSTGIPRIRFSSYLPTFKGKSKSGAHGTAMGV